MSTWWDKKLGQAPQQQQPQRPSSLPPTSLPPVWNPNTQPAPPVQFQAPPQAMQPQQMPRPTEADTGERSIIYWLQVSEGGEGVKSGQITVCPKCGGDVFGGSASDITNAVMNKDGHMVTPGMHCFNCGWNGRYSHTLPPPPPGVG